MTGPRGRRTRGAARGFLVVVFLGAVGFFLGWRWHKPGDADKPLRPTVPFPLATCDGTASYAEAVVSGELRLHRALLPDQTLSAEALHTAVTLQLRYAFASGQNAPAGPTRLTPDGPPRNIELLSQSNVPYGNDLTMDWPADPQLQPESTYVQRALTRRQVAAADAAIVVSYRARVGLARCDQSSESARQADFRFPVPHDPYLLYWHVGRAQRVMQVYGTKRAQTFPCADPEIADYPHPEYLWYFWQPLQPGCPALLPAPRVLGWVSLRIIQRLPPSGDFGPFKRSFAPPPSRAAAAPALRVVLVFGYLDHQAARPDLAQLARCLTAVSASHPQESGSECSYTEWGAAQYGRFLQSAGAVLDVNERVVRVHPEVLETQLSGRLRRSGRRIAITAYLTETDLLAPPPYVPHHIPLVLAALREAEVIVYVGHSGLGANFSVSQLEKSASPKIVAELLRGSPVRVLGFIGCYTYSYFGHDFGQRVGDRGAETLFVYTGNAVEQTAQSALHILSTLDCIMQSPEGRLRLDACELTRAGDAARPDFLIYELAR